MAGTSKLVHLRGVSGASDNFLCSLKVWKLADTEECRWELRRVLPVVGFAESQCTHLCRHLREQWPAWIGLAEHFGLGAQSLGKSRRALLAESDGDELQVEGAEQEFWASTAMVLLLLLHFRMRRRRVIDREQATAVLRLMLEQCLPGPAAEASQPFAVNPEALQECAAEPVINGECYCIREAVRVEAQPAPSGASRQG